MGRILVTGTAGQIGSELVPELRARHGGDRVVAAGHRTPLPDDVRDGGPCITLDVTVRADVEAAVREHDVDVIYHMGSILSALAEANRQTAHAVNVNGLYNVLEAALSAGVRQVNVPSSIAAFGPDTPPVHTPNETLQRPNTLYGIAKVFGELLGNYYSAKLGLDVRGLRLPGIISWKTEPTAGTTDYAVAIFYEAIREGRYTCYLNPDTRLPMMYMPDCIKAISRSCRGGPIRTDPPRGLQRDRRQLHAVRARRRDTAPDAALRDRLRYRPASPGHCRLMARLAGRLGRAR